MKLFVDTNILFSALVKDSMTRKILIHSTLELITLSFSEQEINKYRGEILKRADMDISEFDKIFSQLKNRLIMLEDSAILPHMSEALNIMQNIDIKDSPFIAAALATNAEIWSDDHHFKMQKRVKVWTTKELIKEGVI